MGAVILWIVVSLVGLVFATMLAVRAHYNRQHTPPDPAVYRLMAWSIEIDALLSVGTLTFLLLAGLVATPYVLFGALLIYEEFIRTYVVRPLVVAALVTIVVRLVALYSFLNTIEEQKNDA